ncbi:hypothetical protein HZC34_06915 [Candidatus Saganbacteria bacterium]|nr:hypothetical protein [Candidatus Saganbacteria bacterium]
MSQFADILVGSLAFAVVSILSIILFVVKKYAETIAKLSAEDFYKNKK